jgi:hypothetical protein
MFFFLAYGDLELPYPLSRGFSGFLLEKNKVQIELCMSAFILWQFLPFWIS